MDEVRGSSPLPPTTLAVPRLAALARDARLIRDAGRRPRASPFGGRVERFKSCARAIRGNSPPEEGGATLATSEGPICYRQMGVAPTDGRRPFDSLRSLRPFDVSLEAMSEAAKRTSRMVQVLHRATTLHTRN